MSAAVGLFTGLPKAHSVPRWRLLVPRTVANTMTPQGPSIPSKNSGHSRRVEILSRPHTPTLRVSINAKSLRRCLVQTSQQNCLRPHCSGMAGTPLLRDTCSHGGQQPWCTLSSLGEPPSGSFLRACPSLVQQQPLIQVCFGHSLLGFLPQTQFQQDP